MNVLDIIHHIENNIQNEIQHETIRSQYAWWLLEKLTNRSKTDLILQDDIELTTEQQQQLDIWLESIDQDHKPINYILGSVPFGPLSIEVRPPVLIPRPETEEWVLHLADQIKESGTIEVSILDVGAGSGCIALLLAHMLPNAQVTTCDVCPDALALTRENKQELGIDINIIESDLFGALPEDSTFDLIVSNPPYISPEEYGQLEPSVTQWEHKHALYAEQEGLFFIKRIIEQAPLFLKPNKTFQEHGINQLYIEIGWQQGQIVKMVMMKYGYINVKIHKDSAGKDRVVSGRIKE